jgi:glycosyltransferase involved in cell wall biosynthesis
MTPTVSVIVTSYNYGRFLPEAMDSVLAQTLRDLEVIVIDDGSTDDTAAVTQRYLGDPRIRYHRTDHLGQPKAKNTGIRLTRAGLIAFLDADDAWMPTKLEKQVALFQNRPEVGVVYSRRLMMDEAGRDMPYRQPTLYRGEVLGAMFRRPFVCFSSCMVRRSVFDDVGLFDESIPMSIDYDLWMRAAMRYRFDYVDEPLVKYRTGHANLSQRELERTRIARFIVRRFLDERGGRARVDAALVRDALAELACDMAYAALEKGQKGTSLLEYARSLTYRPLGAKAWRGVCTCWWPEALRTRIRSLVHRLRGHEAPRPERLVPSGSSS